MGPGITRDAARGLMMASLSSMAILLALSQAPIMQQQHVHADVPEVSISIGKETYQYCENLSYVVSVSEITERVAVAHITDQNGKRSQSIPVEISSHENEIRAPFPFEDAIFPTGSYTIDIEYAGARAAASFALIDGGNECIPAQIKQIAAAWLSGTFSDGFLVDAIAKSVDPGMINVPFEINQDVIYDIAVPQWVKQPTYWWLAGQISDDEMARMLDYILEAGIISSGVQETGSASDAEPGGAAGVVATSPKTGGA